MTRSRNARNRQISLRNRKLLVEQLETRVLLASDLGFTPEQVLAAQGGDPIALRQNVSPGDEKVFYDFVNENGELDGGVVSSESLERHFLSKAPLGYGPNPPAPTPGVQTVVNNGPTSNRIDLVVLGDGYTSSDLGAYSTHTTNILNSFFDVSPLDAYVSFFNVHRVDVISNQSGVDGDPNQGDLKDTALDAGYWCSNIERLLCVNVSKANAQAAFAPDVDQILVLANSTKYGGAGYSSSNLGTVAGNNASAIEVAKHEFGHSFGDLADEYTYGGPIHYTGAEKSEINLSIKNAAQIAAEQVKWHRWLNLPNVDAFAGGGYSETGIYRPTDNSLMRNLGRPFEEVNAEQMVVSAYKTVKPIDNATPAGTYEGDDTFFVTPVEPVNHTLDVRWYLDGTAISGATATTFDFASLSLSPGTYTLDVVVTDNTAFVRDPALRAQWLSETRSWQVVVAEPKITLTLNSTANFVENSTAILLTPNATLNAPGVANFNRGILTVDYQSPLRTTDRILIRNQGTGPGQIGVNGTQITYAGQTIGHFSGGTSGTPLAINLNSAANTTRVQSLIRNLKFRAGGENPSPANRIVRMVLDDGAGGSSNVATMRVTVVARNDAPVLNNSIKPTLADIREDVTTSKGKYVAALIKGAVTDPDGTGRGIAVINAPSNAGSWQFTTNNGTSWIKFNLGPGDPARLLPSDSNTRIRFVPNANFYGTANIRYRAWDQTQGNPGAKFNITETGGVRAFSIASTTASITVTPLNDRPEIGGISGSVSYVRGTAPILLAPNATITDVDNSNFNGGQLRIYLPETSPASASGNRLFIRGGFTVDAQNRVFRGTTQIGRQISSGIGTNHLVVNLNQDAIRGVVQQLLRSIRFRTVGNSTTSREVFFRVTDGSGGASILTSLGVNIS